MTQQSSKFSFIGITLGSIALLLALVHFWAGPFSPQPTLEQVVAAKAVAIKKAAISALNGEELQTSVTQRRIDADTIISLSTAILGGLAIILGVYGFAVKEPLRVAGGAAALGGSAIAFQFVALAVGALIVAILVAAVLSQIGIG